MESIPSPTAADLIAAREGDPVALGRVLESCRPYLLLVAERDLSPMLRAKGGASDLVQQTYLKAHTAFNDFQGEDRDQLLAWLRAILRNNLLNFQRQYRGTERRDARREVQVGVDSTAGSTVPAARTPTPSVTVADAERAAAVRTAICRLSADHQEVLRLRYELNLSFADVATRMGRTPVAARQLWARAVARLEAELGDVA